VLDLDEAPAHPQNADRGAFVERDGAVQPAPAPRFSRTPSEIDATPPGGGAAVLEHWGFAAGEIDALRASGAI
jgi:alpha-methylacyl-CoA racemase